MHPWHDIPIGEEAPFILNAVIEIPMDSKVKYELDKTSGLIRIDRILHASMHYPLNYGFIPQTYCDDKDPLDVLVIGQYPVIPGSIMSVRPLAAFKMVDNDEQDDKVIAVHTGDPHFRHYRSEADITVAKMEEIKHFFENYKLLQKKNVSIEGKIGTDDTIKVIRKSITDYQEMRANR